MKQNRDASFKVVCTGPTERKMCKNHPMSDKAINVKNKYLLYKQFNNFLDELVKIEYFQHRIETSIITFQFFQRK